MEEYFEEIVIELMGDKVIPRINLHSFLISSLAMFSKYESYYIKCKEVDGSWQSETLVSVDVYLGNDEQYETQEDIDEGSSSYWDSLKVSYLMATQPRKNIPGFCDVVLRLSEHFSLSMSIAGKIIEEDKLRTHLESIADILTKKYSEPGSKLLCMLIEESYPR